MSRLYNILDNIVSRVTSAVITRPLTMTIPSTATNTGGYASATPMSVSGYEPIGVISVQLQRSTTWTLGQINYNKAEDGKIYVSARNMSGSTQTLDVTVTVLYVKQSIWGGYSITVFSMLSAISSFVRGWRHEQTIQHLGCTGSERSVLSWGMDCNISGGKQRSSNSRNNIAKRCVCYNAKSPRIYKRLSKILVWCWDTIRWSFGLDSLTVHNSGGLLMGSGTHISKNIVWDNTAIWSSFNRSELFGERIYQGGKNKIVITPERGCVA